MVGISRSDRRESCTAGKLVLSDFQRCSCPAGAGAVRRSSRVDPIPDVLRKSAWMWPVNFPLDLTQPVCPHNVDEAPWWKSGCNGASFATIGPASDFLL